MLSGQSGVDRRPAMPPRGTIREYGTFLFVPLQGRLQLLLLIDSIILVPTVMSLAHQNRKQRSQLERRQFLDLKK